MKHTVLIVVKIIGIITIRINQLNIVQIPHHAIKYMMTIIIGCNI